MRFFVSTCRQFDNFIFCATAAVNMSCIRRISWIGKQDVVSQSLLQGLGTCASMIPFRSSEGEKHPQSEQTCLRVKRSARIETHLSLEGILLLLSLLIIYNLAMSREVCKQGCFHDGLLRRGLQIQSTLSCSYTPHRVTVDTPGIALRWLLELVSNFNSMDE